MGRAVVVWMLLAVARAVEKRVGVELVVAGSAVLVANALV